MFQKSLQTFKEIHIKNCKEIQFSHGGHLFAAMNTNSIHVFNFYTGECSSDYIFKDHKGKVQSISWFHDDSGFISAGLEGMIFIWDLKNSNKPEYQYHNKGNNISCVEAASEGTKRLFYVGSDKTLREISYESSKDSQGSIGGGVSITNDKSNKQILKASQKKRFESNVVFAQVCALGGERGLIVGTADNDRPGSIMIFRIEKMERVFDI